MINVYIATCYNHEMGKSTFAIYCPGKNFCFYSGLPSLYSGAQAEYLAIERTVRIIESRLMSSSALKDRYTILCCLAEAVQEWSRLNKLQGQRIDAFVDSQSSKSMKVADCMAREIN